ncbi:MAG: hypothetical protein ACLUEQ_10505 [Cloacibacillus evryensis]
MDFFVEADVFEYFPGMRLVVAAAEGMSLPAGTEPVAAFLRDSWRIAAEASTAYGNPQSHPNIKRGERMKWPERREKISPARSKLWSGVPEKVRGHSPSTLL